MTAAEFEAERQHRERERHEEYWAEPADPWADVPMSKPTRLNIPEPPELTEWAARRVEEKRWLAAEAAIPCAVCRKPKGHRDHIWGADTLQVRCSFVDTPCPNENEPVLCKFHDGVFIPEASCPRHDAEYAS